MNMPDGCSTRDGEMTITNFLNPSGGLKEKEIKKSNDPKTASKDLARDKPRGNVTA